MKELYDRDYFERGIETGKSCYQNYRWTPELTIPMAMTIIDYLGIKPQHRIMDFGCAKGYLVKALRWLNRKAYGVDISQYAIDNCDSEVEGYCFRNGHTPLIEDYVVWLNRFSIDFCIAKDVFEHVELSILENLFKSNMKVFFAVIPLGENGKFRAPSNNLDVTHINCMNEREWLQFFKDNGMKCEDFTFRIKGIKDSYYEQYPISHGFFTLCQQ